jgi:hypothetical protein
MYFADMTRIALPAVHEEDCTWNRPDDRFFKDVLASFVYRSKLPRDI